MQRAMMQREMQRAMMQDKMQRATASSVHSYVLANVRTKRLANPLGESKIRISYCICHIIPLFFSFLLNVAPKEPAVL